MRILLEVRSVLIWRLFAVVTFISFLDDSRKIIIFASGINN